jgi:glycosyltransferase involved in cell wall biosynthesis
MTSPTRPVIVHVMGWESQQYGSFERQLVLLGERLAAAGAELHLVFRQPPRSAAFVDEVRATLHVLPGARGGWDLRYVARCATLLQRLSATHLHAHHGTDAYLAVLAARIAGVGHRYATKHITPGRSRLTASRLRHRALANQVETVFAVSQHVADGLVRLGVPPASIEVNLMGTDADRYRPDAARRRVIRDELGITDDVRLVLTTSHLRPGKGVDRMPAVAAALTHDPRRCLVALVGDGDLARVVADDAIRRGVGPDAFRQLGRRDDVPALLAAADVFVLPTDGTEGLGASAFEALASGTPAVVTDVSDLRPLLGSVAEIVPPGRTLALVKAIRRVLAAPSTAALRAREGRRLIIAELGLGRSVDRLVEVYLAGHVIDAASARAHLDPCLHDETTDRTPATPMERT